MNKNFKKIFNMSIKAFNMIVLDLVNYIEGVTIFV